MFDQCSKICLWCDSGINVTGVTNHFLLRVKAHFTIPSLCKPSQEPMVCEFIGPRGESTTTILLIDIESNCSLNFDPHSHSLIQLLDLIRKVPLCAGGGLMQKLTTAQPQV